MCGIFSYVKNSENLSEKEINFSRKKTNELKHRGPDHYGEWINKNIFLGIQRLAINDLSVSGNQPFYFEDKVMVFNGEVYNYVEKRKILEEKGYKFKSNSDTEVFFYYIIEYGFKNLDKINGMFSFIYFDGKKIHFGNDIFSEKTLFYYIDKSKILISSELSNLSDISEKSENKELIYSYLSFGHLIGNKTFYKNIYKLTPGQILTVDQNFNIKFFKFFDPKKHYLNNNKSQEHPKLKTNVFFENIENSLKQKFFADREIGILYSGGIDSTIVADQFLNNKKNFTIATYAQNKKKFIDENQHTKGIDSIFINDDNLKMDNKSVLRLFGQPMDSFTSLAIESLCCELSKKNINCALSGMGGDELFFGYNKFYDHMKIKFQINKILKLGIKSFNPSLLSKSHLVFDFIKNKDYLEWINDIFVFNNNYSLIENIFFNDIEYFLPNSRCLTNDVASMRQSVELRGVFLDIDLLKNILNYNLDDLASLGKKRILIDFHNNKVKNFNNYFKHPFYIKSNLNDYDSNKKNQYIKSFLPGFKKKILDDALNDRTDMLLSFF